MGCLNDDFSCVHCYMNSQSISKANNRNFIDSTNKRDENDPNLSAMEKYRITGCCRH